ncbi:hypothetical protein D917_08999 [Trichinella nativa]|uniref:Uncharacterized protein n=1 Tax=Trichinella nativa TaxID=6335 RepID=A0A1Y3EHD7_9BILA|nr:hypothetical protein D917_08999 [Trichinella nativa]
MIFKSICQLSYGSPCICVVKKLKFRDKRESDLFAEKKFASIFKSISTRGGQFEQGIMINDKNVTSRTADQINPSIAGGGRGGKHCLAFLSSSNAGQYCPSNFLLLFSFL